MVGNEVRIRVDIGRHQLFMGVLPAAGRNPNKFRVRSPGDLHTKLFPTKCQALQRMAFRTLIQDHRDRQAIFPMKDEICLSILKNRTQSLANPTREKQGGAALSRPMSDLDVG